MKPKPRERDINSGIKTILELDGWHVFSMETLWRDDWKKGTGEPGMPDILAIRYSSGGTPQSLPQCAEVLWIEGKSSRGKLAHHQLVWHCAERARGALTWIAGNDFPASVEGFLGKYKSSDLCRRKLVAT